MAIPPQSGIGTVCMSRCLGRLTTPKRTAKRSTIGVVKNAITNDAAKTTAH
jgi:hypothetical protein